MKIPKYIKLVAVVSLFSSCDKYLDKDPDLRTDISSPDKVSELLVSAYSIGNYYSMMEGRTDNVTVNPGMDFNDVNTYAYYWRDLKVGGQDAPNYFWSTTYQAIAAANHALKEIEDAPDAKDYVAQKGEALVCRAYAHFMLVSLFSKFYDPATAKTDPGIPYMTEVEDIVWKNYDRGTVEEVFQKIEADLVEGISLIRDNYKVPAFHFTKKAANAFATRFFLFKRDFDKAIKYASDVFPGGNFQANIRDLKGAYSTLGSEAFGYAYTHSSEKANLLLAETQSWYARTFRLNYYSMNQMLKEDIYDRTIVGKLTAYRTWSVRGYLHYTRKFMENFVTNSINSTSGRGWVMSPLFTTEEVLLSRAEAYAEQMQFDNAMADINLFIKNRIKDADYNASKVVDLAKLKAYFYGRGVNEEMSDEETKIALVKTCLQLRRVEFASEGLRWFDILRHKLVVNHELEDGKFISLDVNDKRRVMQIPEDATMAGLELNPR